jgi:AAHS family benzoate transporter-like MFS transporter
MKSPRPELATAHASMRRIDVHKLADEAKFNNFHCSVLIWCFVILVLDGYDLAVAGTALPSIMKAMNVEAATAGFMASSALFGMMFGAIVLGALADKIGRRWRSRSVCSCSASSPRPPG